MLTHTGWQAKIDRRADAFVSRRQSARRIADAHRCAFYADDPDCLTTRQQVCWGVAGIAILLFVAMACLALVGL